MIKYIVYFLHILFIFMTTIGIFFNFYLLILNFITILSWYINSNKCLITQMEYYFFNESLIDYFYKSKNFNTKFIVPSYHRNIVKIIFLIGLLYYLN